jgi:hypothetical protein
MSKPDPRYSITWSLSLKPPGVYHCILRAFRFLLLRCYLSEALTARSETLPNTLQKLYEIIELLPQNFYLQALWHGVSYHRVL